MPTRATTPRSPAPPHCPYRRCKAHRRRPGQPFRFQRRGFRIIKRSPEPNPRYLCRHCGRSFSGSTFTPDYWKKIAGLHARVYDRLANGQAQRQVARGLRVAPKTVALVQRQLAKQCLLRHLQHLRQLAGRFTEPVVLDGLRTFAGSQFEPLDLNTTIAAQTGFLLHLEAAPLRRSGTMTARQRQLRAQRDRALGRPIPGIRRRITRRTLRLLGALAPAGHRIELRTDEEPDYARAVDQVAVQIAIAHQTTSSKRRRDTRNPLWRVNHLHRVTRHSLKSQARETLAFHKCLRGLMERALIAQCWLNATKGISERNARLSRQTPAMLLGLEERPRRGDEYLRDRLFPARVGLPPGWRRLFDGRVIARPRERRARFEPLFVD